MKFIVYNFILDIQITKKIKVKLENNFLFVQVIKQPESRENLT